MSLVINMPALILERLPLPSLQTYISFSVVMLGLASFYAHQTVNTILNFNPDNQIQEELGLPQELVNITLPYDRDEHFLNMVYIMRVETWCIWTLVNSCYCLLILFGKLIQNVVFGELRVIEKQHLKDKFWNFIFYKFIFIFGVMNVQSMEEVVLWLAWFSGLGFLHLLTQLCKDRFEYLSFSPATPRYAHVKLLSLLLVILLTSGVVLVGCFWVGINISLTIFAFLAAESLLLILKCLYVVLYGNIFLSMASLVICMQLRFLFYEFQRRVKKHKNYLKVVKEMESKFSMATQEDLEQNSDDCAICWEKMESARKLPCGHLFHNSCLRSWLEQDSSCPTCRTRLSETTERDGRNPGAPGVPNMAEGIVAPVNPATTNHFFHFDGSRYVSWLPSFSVEVTHTNLLPGQQAHATQTSQLDNMAREVQAVFPHIPQQVIMEDLRLTRSVDLTIDNILEGRITVPPLAITGSGHQRNDSHSSISGSSTTSEVSSLASDSPRVNNIPLNNLDNSLQLTEGSSERIRQSENQENSYTTTGGRFSKSATERMSMLESRKHLMLEQARRRYQEMHENQEGASSSSVDPPLIYTTSEHLRQIHSESSTLSTQEDELSRRRALLLQATQRRLERQTD
uniref:RING-type domain-containing protein n=1 Tax=Biomphalaria glabrata TaxID=6526 RepID=A0A2C9KM42_BIOGL